MATMGEVEPCSMGSMRFSTSFYFSVHVFDCMIPCAERGGDLIISPGGQADAASQHGNPPRKFCFQLHLSCQSVAYTSRISQWLCCFSFALSVPRSQFITAGFDVRVWVLRLHAYPLRSVWL